MRKLTFYFLKFQFNNFAEILHNIFFFIVSLFIFSFFVSESAGGADAIYAGLLFIILLLTLNLRASLLFTSEYRNGILEQLILHNYTPMQIVSARFFSFYLSEILPLIFLLPIAAIFFHFSPGTTIFLGITFALSLPLLLSIFLLNATLLLPINNKAMLLTAISFPLIVGPTILIALTILSYFKPETGEFASYLETIIYLTFMVTPLTLFLASKALSTLYQDKFIS